MRPVSHEKRCHVGAKKMLDERLLPFRGGNLMGKRRDCGIEGSRVAREPFERGALGLRGCPLNFTQRLDRGSAGALGVVCLVAGSTCLLGSAHSLAHVHAGFLLDLLERRELFGEHSGMGLGLGSLRLGAVELEG